MIHKTKTRLREQQLVLRQAVGCQQFSVASCFWDVGWWVVVFLLFRGLCFNWISFLLILRFPPIVLEKFSSTQLPCKGFRAKKHPSISTHHQPKTTWKPQMQKRLTEESLRKHPCQLHAMPARCLLCREPFFRLFSIATLRLSCSYARQEGPPAWGISLEKSVKVLSSTKTYQPAAVSKQSSFRKCQSTNLFPAKQRNPSTGFHRQDPPQNLERLATDPPIPPQEVLGCLWMKYLLCPVMSEAHPPRSGPPCWSAKS